MTKMASIAFASLFLLLAGATSAQEWLIRAPMPTVRDHLAVAVVRGKLYAIGGRLESYARNISVNEEYDPKTDTWRARSPLPTPRSGIAAVSTGSKIYVFGGERPEGTFNQNEEYDPATDSWRAMPPMPTPRHGLGAAYLDGKIYVIGGGPRPGGSYSDKNEVFIPKP